ncbi:hypothetical protein JOM56_012264 [Amanita muscaria]
MIHIIRLHKTILLRHFVVILLLTKNSRISSSWYGIVHQCRSALTREADDWYPVLRQLKILEAGLALCPELPLPEVRALRQPAIENILPPVVYEGCGLRPARKVDAQLFSPKSTLW